MRAHESGAGTVAAVPMPDGEPGPLTLATQAELKRAGRLESTAGVAAVLLARRLDAQTTDTGSSVAALVREHRVTLAEATRGAVMADPIDELRARRDAARRAG